MTIPKFFGIFFLQLVLFTAFKVYFFQHSYDQSVGWEFLYWAVIAFLTVFLVRRIGVMNYLEAIFTAVFWVVFDLLVDLILTSGLSGLAIFSSQSFWVGYIIMALSVFSFHKKRHVHIRKGLYKDPHASH